MFGKRAGETEPPRLDASRPTGRLVVRLTPNHIVNASRAGFVALLLIALVAGPDGLASPALRFTVAYSVTLTAIPGFPRIGAHQLGLAIALLLGARWAFSAPDGATVEMFLTELAGTVFALAPVYARTIGRLAGTREGHVSVIDRHAMRRRRADTSPPHASAVQQPAPVLPVVALLEYRPDSRKEALPSSPN